jgi:hypothetical protein
MEIANMHTFNQFGQDMIHAESLSWRLSGMAILLSSVSLSLSL